MKKVACLGILVADVIVEPVNKYPDKGVLEKVNSITVHNGGNAMTASVNLKKLGVESSIVGMVGNDMFGDFLNKKLTESMVDTRGLKVSNTTQTSASVLMIDKGAGLKMIRFNCDYLEGCHPKILEKLIVAVVAMEANNYGRKSL